MSVCKICNSAVNGGCVHYWFERVNALAEELNSAQFGLREACDRRDRAREELRVAEDQRNRNLHALMECAQERDGARDVARFLNRLVRADEKMDNPIVAAVFAKNAWLTEDRDAERRKALTELTAQAQAMDFYD